MFLLSNSISEKERNNCSNIVFLNSKRNFFFFLNCYAILLFELKDEHGSSVLLSINVFTWSRSGVVTLISSFLQHKNNQVNFKLWWEARTYGDIQLMPITSGLLWKHMQFASKGKIIGAPPSLYGSTYWQFYFKAFSNIVPSLPFSNIVKLSIRNFEMMLSYFICMLYSLEGDLLDWEMHQIARALSSLLCSYWTLGMISQGALGLCPAEASCTMSK